MPDRDNTSLASHHPRWLNRQKKLADLARRCRSRATPRWWTLADIFESIRGIPTWAGLAQDRFYEHFAGAVQAGMFDRAGKTRIAILNPQGDVRASRWPQLRLTADSVEQMLTDCAPTEWQSKNGRSAAGIFFTRYGYYVWVEIDQVHDWLATWLDQILFEHWVRCPVIAAAISAASHAKPRQPARAWPTTSISEPPSPPPTEAGTLVEEVARWLADRAARGEKLTKDAAFTLARQEFGPALSRRKFVNSVWPVAAPNAWKRPGRPRKQ